MIVEYLYESKADDTAKTAKLLTKAEKEKKEKIDKELERLSKLLHDGECEFEYEKKDGSTRHARGTLKTVLIPKDEREDKRKYTKSDEVFYYYDLDSDGWRAFRKENFKKIIEK